MRKFLRIVGNLAKDKFEDSIHKLAQRGRSLEAYLRQRMEDFMMKYNRSPSFRRELTQESLDQLSAQFSENIENLKEAAEEL